MDRTILHCDLNNFFASVSLLECQTLKNEPVAVCGSVEDRHGIVLAKNEVAKKYGVKTAEVIWEAKLKCPNLVILPPNYKKYEEYSKKTRAIYERYTDIIEPFGIDECWLDVTGSKLLFGSGEEIANKIRLQVKYELGLTISVGVSFNKVFAKLGSDMKKPDAVTVISRENFKEKVWPLPVSDLLFIGKKTTERLNRLGIYTIGDIGILDDLTLKRHFGKCGIDLKNNALGLDNSPVTPYTEDYMPKSIGRSVTPKKDISGYDGVWKIYVELAEDIAGQLHKKGLVATGICIHIRTNDLEVKEISKTFRNGTDCSMTLAKRAMEMIKANFFFERPLRSVGFRAINLKPKCESGYQNDLFGDSLFEEKEEIIENSILDVREKYGNKSIKRAVNVENEP
ncbi:MAG: DNA polymerase IV [Clostridia bacterium]|nr:DNA polymerase IV [Clostridia bacterium]